MPALHRSVAATFSRPLVVCAMFVSPLFMPLSARAQAAAGTAPTVAASAASKVPAAKPFAGDALDSPGPMATDLSPKLKSPAIRNAMKKVASWQVAYAEPKFDSLWTMAALYDGLISASETTGDPTYRDAVLHFAEQQHWKLMDDHFPHADFLALGKAYTELYLTEPKAEQSPEQIAATKAFLDRLMARPDGPSPEWKHDDLWWWCDALYMAPPVFVRMAKITGDHKYIDYMNKEWDITTSHLYNEKEHLYFRDSRYFTKTEANGRPLFWSRGNGWVMGALVAILRDLPADDPSRPKFVAKLQEMSAALAAIQGSDGLWRSGILDPDSYPLPEVSGSAFFTEAMAYGINEHLLDRKKYMPVVEKAWAGMLTHVYADGRLGSIQPIDAQPGQFKPSASYVYGVGGFLLAGTELDRLVRHKP